MNKKLLSLLIILFAALISVVLFTSPHDSPLILIMAPILLIGCISGLVVYLILTSSGSKSRARTFYFPLAAGLMSSLFVVMTSLRQLNLTTGLLMFVFASLFVFYIGKSKK